MDEAAPRIDTQEALEDLFERVRRMFFPRWRRGKNWSVKLGVAPGRPRLRGWCDLEERTIWMKPQWRDDENVEASVIHEVIHAVVGAEHDGPFQRRMLKAADDAEAQGNAALASELRKEVADWAAEPRYRVSEMYAAIRRDAAEVSSYEAFRQEFAERDGLLPEEFDRKYRRARRVYEQKRREVAKDQRSQEEWMAAMSRQDE